MKPSPASERSLRLAPDGISVLILDQTLLPHGVKTVRLRTLEQAAHAIRTMQVRGSNLIGVTAAYGMALALRADATNSGLEAAYSVLIETRPTAVNLRWALDLMRDFLRPMPASLRVDAAYAKAAELLEEDVATNRSIGDHGLWLNTGDFVGHLTFGELTDGQVRLRAWSAEGPSRVIAARPLRPA